MTPSSDDSRPADASPGTADDPPATAKPPARSAAEESAKSRGPKSLAPKPSSSKAPTPKPAPPDGTGAGATGAAGSSVEKIVQEIRDELAGISAHELQLRRREHRFEEQYRQLEQAARQAVAREIEQTQQSLARRNAELSAQFIEVASRQSQLDERDRALQEQQVELARQREQLAAETAALHRRAEQLESQDRSESAALAQRGAAIHQQEQELARRMQLARDQIAHQRAEVEQRLQALDERDARLAQAEAELQARQSVLAQVIERDRLRAAEFQRQTGELAAREAALADERRRVEDLDLRQQTEREALAQRSGAVRQQEQELTRRLQLARDQIAQQRVEIEARLQVLDEREARAAETEAGLQAQQTTLADAEQQEALQTAEIRRQQQDLRAEQAALADERRHLDEASEALDRGRQALAEKQREIERRAHSTDQQQRRLTREAENAAKRQQSLEQEVAALREREQRLTDRERQLQDQTATLEAARQRQAQVEAELGQRVEAVDALFKQAEEVGQQAREHHNEALAFQEQAEARDRESAQAALAVELERQQIDTERRALDAAQAKLDGLRAQGQQDLAVARRTLVEHTERLGAWEQSLHSAARRRWRRAALVGVVAAAAGAAGWVVSHPPQYRAAREIRITSESSAMAAVTAQHRQQLAEPELLDDDPVAGSFADAWRSACVEHYVEVATVAGRPALRLLVSADGPAAARRLVETATDVYARRVNAVQPDPRLPPHYQTLELLRDRLEKDRQTAEQSRSADAESLNRVPGPEQRQQVLSEIDRLRAELDTAVGALAEARAALAAVNPDEPVHGTVDPAAVDKALVDDLIYQEDRKEFRAVALQYRTELSVAMLTVADPAKVVAKSLADSAASLSEQRSLSPPAEVSAVLEACSADVAQLQQQLTPFVEQWQKRAQTVQSLNTENDVVELAGHQNASAEAARRICDDVRRLLESLQGRIDGLDKSGGGGTREIVVAAVLRSDHAALKAAADNFLSAATKTSLSDNIELDAQDRRLRGLRMRLSQRRESVQQRLQVDADRRAAEERAARLADLRQKVDTLDQQREALIVRLMAALKTIRALDDAARQRADLEARLSRFDAQIDSLRTQIDDLNRRLEEARRQGPKPDRADVGETTVERISRLSYAHAALAAGTACVGAWLVCVLMIGRGLWRTRRTQAEPLPAGLSSAPVAEPANPGP